MKNHKVAYWVFSYVYLNDLERYLCKSYVNLFADDTVISVFGSNYKELL